MDYNKHNRAFWIVTVILTLTPGCLLAWREVAGGSWGSDAGSIWFAFLVLPLLIGVVAFFPVGVIVAMIFDEFFPPQKR